MNKMDGYDPADWIPEKRMPDGSILERHWDGRTRTVSGTRGLVPGEDPKLRRMMEQCRREWEKTRAAYRRGFI